jgi:hypothetical protein
MAESREELLARAVEIRDEHRTNANTPMRVGGALYQMVSSMQVIEFDVTAPPYSADRTGVEDATEAIQDAMDDASTARGRVVIPHGTYTVTEQLLLPESSYLDMQLDGDLDFTGCTGLAARDACIRIGEANGSDPEDMGGLTALPALGAHANEHAMSVTFASAHGLAAGDLFILIDEDDYSWHTTLIAENDRPYYHRGEYLRVRSVTSDTVVAIDNRLHDTYLTSENIALYRVAPSRVLIRGIGQIICPGLAALDVGIHLNNCYQSSIEGITITGARYAGFEFWRCFDTDATGVNTVSFHTAADEGAGAFLIANYNCNVYGGTFHSGRHGISITGFGIPNRYCYIYDATLRADQAALDMHGHAEYCGFIDCQVDGSMSLGGKNVKTSGCTITACRDFLDAGDFQGHALRLREVKGGSFLIEDTEIIVNDVVVGDLPVFELNTYSAMEPGKVVVNGLTIRSNVHNPVVMELHVEDEDEQEFILNNIVYEGPPGEKAPEMRLSSSSGAFKRVALSGVDGVAITSDGMRARETSVSDSRVTNADNFGISLSVLEWAGEAQFIDVDNFKTRENDAAGIFLSGTDASYDVYATIKNCRSLNNGQAGVAAASKSSLRAEDLKSLELTGNTWGDTQTVATQGRLIHLDTVTTLLGGGNRAIGTIDYGSSATARSLTSVTNDLEVIELIGSAAPEASVFGSPGWKYTRTDGTLWLKATGTATNTGWIQTAGATGYVTQPYTRMAVALLTGGGPAIVSGSISPTTSWILVDTEGSAATDDLDTIDVSAFAGGLFVLQAFSDARTVVVKHNTGNILCPGGVDFSLDNVNDKVLCFYDSNAAKVCVLAAVNLGA